MFKWAVRDVVEREEKIAEVGSKTSECPTRKHLSRKEEIEMGRVAYLVQLVE
jgi:hypothetical protein